MFLNKTGFILLLFFAFWSTGCARTDRELASPSPTLVARTGQLTPYVSTPNIIPGTPHVTPTRTPLPSPTATPVTHIVVKGEDMSGIDLRYGIDLAQLMAANPTVNPHFMSIGTVLVIPASGTKEPTAGPGAADVPLQTPTPVAVETGSITCTTVEDGGIWCFQPITNRQSYPIEGLAAIFQLAGPEGDSAQSLLVSPVLDLIPSGATLPLAAYFPPDPSRVFGPAPSASSQLVSALPNRDDGRYLSSHAENQKVVISEDGLSATITLDVIIDQPDTRARRIWVAATAYSREGRIIGVRRWEKPDQDPIPTGKSQPVTMYVYSIAGEIDRVEIVVESRP